MFEQFEIKWILLIWRNQPKNNNNIKWKVAADMKQEKKYVLPFQNFNQSRKCVRSRPCREYNTRRV